MKANSLIFAIALLVFNTSTAQIYFADEAANIGLTEHSGNSVLGPGISVADFDNDGWDDITLASGPNSSLRFYRNSQGVFFEQFLLDTPITYQTRAITWVDYDNDGDLDLFVASDQNSNKLFEKTSSGLVDVTITSGLPTGILFTYGASWGDINNDGCLDLYLSNRVKGQSISNYLYQNNCDGTFSEVTNSVGLANDEALSFCSGFFDYNNDGWIDLYVSNDKNEPNFLYKNNGNGTFSDVSLISGTGIIIDAMSVTVDDFNSDGFLDLFITNTPDFISTMTNGSVLFRNNGDETFTDISVDSGTNLNSFSWGSNFFDAENDGDLDLYVACSFDGSNGYESYAFYENSGNEVFTKPLNVGFENNDKRSYASAIGDINNDGKIDIIVINNNDEPPFIWNNQTNTSNNYLAITLEGTVSNRNAIGSKVEISVNGEIQYRYFMLGEGYLSQNSFKEVFGVGSATLVDYIKITWPSGLVDILSNVSSNNLVHIIEGQTLTLDENSQMLFAYYPNPTKNVLYFNSKKPIDSLSIFNLLGQEILRRNPKVINPEIDLSNLKSGSYFVKVLIDNQTETIKILKN